MKKVSFLIAIFIMSLNQVKAQSDTLFYKDFNDESITSGGWVNELVSGPENCYWQIFSSDDQLAKVSNYLSGENQACESWLISPSVDLTNVDPSLGFRSSYNFNGDPLELMISTDYQSGNPSLATWTDISNLAIFATTDGYQWQNSGTIDLSAYAVPNVRIGFKYTGSNNDGSTWNLDDIILLSGEIIEPTESWNCEAFSCVESTDGNGEFNTLEDCLATCQDSQIVVTSIYDIQYTENQNGNSQLEGQIVSTGGIVTAIVNDTSAYFIQNGSGPWSGIYVYDLDNSPELGDSVTFDAEVYEFYNLTELKNITNYNKVSSNNIFTATEVSPEMANNEAYEGVFVKLTNIECIETLDQYDEWTVSDGSFSVKISDFIYSYTPVLNQSYDIVGPLTYSFEEFKVCPRSISDITVITTSNMEDNLSTKMQFYPNPSNGIIQLINDAAFEIFNLSGQLVYQANLPSKKVNLKSLKPGTYICKFYNNSGELNATNKLILF